MIYIRLFYTRTTKLVHGKPVMFGLLKMLFLYFNFRRPLCQTEMYFITTFKQWNGFNREQLFVHSTQLLYQNQTGLPPNVHNIYALFGQDTSI